MYEVAKEISGLVSVFSLTCTCKRTQIQSYGEVKLMSIAERHTNSVTLPGDFHPQIPVWNGNVMLIQIDNTSN